MRFVTGAVALVGALVLASTAAAADLELGKELYTKKCAGCHGADGKGNPKMSQMLKVTIPDLSAGVAKTDADLVKLVSEGKKPMPSFAKSLSPDEVKAVVEYAKRFATGRTAGTK